MTRSKLCWFIVFSFIALIFKLATIAFTKQANYRFVDLGIYIDGGQLISHGINPYDFEDNKTMRKQFRLDTIAYHPETSYSQNTWDYYASGNLPLSLLLYGIADSINSGNPWVYRILFAFLDSLLCGIISILVIFYWKVNLSRLQRFFIAAGIGIFSSFLFYEGILIPEDKGTQILFMLVSVFFALEKRVIWCAIFIGLSIAFKGIGVFIIPLCLFYLFEDNKTKSVFGFLTLHWKEIIWVGVISSVVVLITFLPFGVKVIDMIMFRLSHSTSTFPDHSSMWRVFYKISPQLYHISKNIFLFLLGVIVLIGIYRNRIEIELFTSLLLVVFINILLIDGSICRMNISFLSVIVILGLNSKNLQLAYKMCYFYIFGGLIVLSLVLLNLRMNFISHYQWIDSIFSLLFVLLFVVLLFQKIFTDHPKPILNEYKSND